MLVANFIKQCLDNPRWLNYSISVHVQGTSMAAGVNSVSVVSPNIVFTTDKKHEVSMEPAAQPALAPTLIQDPQAVAGFEQIDEETVTIILVDGTKHIIKQYDPEHWPDHPY